MSKLIDLTGQRFGRLTVICRADTKSKDVKWLCKWADITGIKQATIRARIYKYGWSVKDALTLAVKEGD